MSGEISKKNNNGLQPWENFGTYVQARAELEMEIVRDELGAKQLNALITATTEEELDEAMKMAGLVGLRDMEDGTEIRINEFHYAPGSRADYANRFGVFAVLDCVLLATGQSVVLDTGVERIIVWLRAHELMTPEGTDPWPTDRKISKIQTGSGNDMITLVPIPKRVTG